MFRQIYKTLLVSIMCGSLSIMNMTAFAEESGGSNGSGGSSGSSASSSNMTRASAPQGLTRDSNGVYKKTETKKFDKIEDKDLIASITMLATGFIAARLYMKYSPITTDMTVAAIGGAAFIAGEITSNMGFKKTMDEMTLEVTKSSDGKNDQAQIDRLNDLKKSYEEAKKTTQTKKMLQTAAAYAFAGAGLYATYLNYQEYSLFMTCISAAKAASACNGVGTSLATSMESLDTMRQNPGPTKAKGTSVESLRNTIKTQFVTLTSACAAVAAESAGTGSAVIALGNAAVSSCEAALDAQTINQTIKLNASNLSDIHAYNNIEKIFPNQMYLAKAEQKKLFSHPLLVMAAKAMNFFFPKAEASWLPLLGLASGAALAVFGASYLGLATETDYFMLSPFNRIIAWGTLGTLSFLAANASQSQMDKIDENIKKIDQILMEMNALKRGVQAGTFQEQQIRLAGFQTNQTTDLQLNQNASVKTNCIASAGDSNCAPLSNQITSMPGFANLPASFQSIGTQTARLGDGLSGTNVLSGSTLSTAGSMANNANAVAKMNKSMKNKLNDLLAKNGKAKIDFDKEEKNFLERLNAQTKKALQSNGMSASGFLASTGISPISSSLSKNPAATASKKMTAVSGAGAVAASAKKEKGMDFEFKEAEGETAFATGAEPATDKDAKYDIGQNDINTNSGESIFQMISNRYIKSGYPKLLEEEPVKN